jgi:hypothetical protein
MRIDLLGQRTIEVTEDEAAAITAEVEALGAVDAIRGSAPEGQILEVNDGNAVVILRALDHVRNAHGSQRATGEARDSLLRYAALSPLAYTLRSWEFKGGEERTFWSFTGSYEEGDRIVEGNAKAYEVVRVERPATPLEQGVLLVQSSRSSYVDAPPESEDTPSG